MVAGASSSSEVYIEKSACDELSETYSAFSRIRVYINW